MIPDLLIASGLILIGIHFTIPLFYFIYMKKVANNAWTVYPTSAYQPVLTVILPTYNEEQFIISRLNDLQDQTYPKKLLRIIVADDASSDNTRKLVADWIRTNTQTQVMLTEQANHVGKMPMIRDVLSRLDPDSGIVVLTDADVFWQKDALTNAARYFGDANVGAVTGSIQYTTTNRTRGESTYRDFYNLLRVAESKVHSTPIQNGPFLALRYNFLHQYGTPTFEGVDDSAIGSFFAFAGARAIQAEDVKIIEITRGSLIRRKTRRANRLIMSFLNTRNCAIRRGVYKRSAFETIWDIEYWLHLINPWLLFAGISLLFIDLILDRSPTTPLATVLLGGALLLYAPFRVWITQQFYLIGGRLRGLLTRDVTWQT